MGTNYRHTQVSRATVGGMGIAWAAAIWWSLRVSDPVPVTTAVLIGFVLVLFSTLTVIVRDGAMDVFFGPGLIRRRIPLRRIREVRVVKTPWYYGWGIRLTPTGWMWNVSGLGGVEVQFDDRHRFRVGSDEPNELAEALLREMQTVERAARACPP
jgi:hypothetical protein